jgi:uncharacterized protein (TIGR02300 family)
MAKAEWGKKRICPACGLKYYDFNNSPITCPACKAEFDPDIYLKSRKGKSLSVKPVVETKEEVSNLDDIEIERDEEVVSDVDPIHELNKDDNEQEEIDIDTNISFIEDEDVNEEDETSVEIIDDEKN